MPLLALSAELPRGVDPRSTVAGVPPARVARSAVASGDFR